MIGTELAAKRERCGLTQGQLAEYFGIGRTSVWRMERGSDPIPRAVEVSSETLEVGNPAFEKWIESLSSKHKLMLRRRQLKNSVKEIL